MIADLDLLWKFRLSNHRLPVETGRWDNTPLEDRKFTLCIIIMKIHIM